MSEVVTTRQQELAGKYRPYPGYKGSGVEWLGEIPAHWNVSRIKYVAQLNPSKSEVRGLSDNTIVSFIPMEAIGERGGIDVSRTRLLGDVLTGYSYITDGDVILAKITPCFENGKGAVVNGLENGIGFATTEVIPARPYRKSDAQFLYYLFTSNPFKALAEGSMYGAGGQKRVADSFVAEYHFAEAPTDERDTIAAFLDYETARIDQLIAQQQRLIELLKEKRQAVISHAVTKGLNPDAPMKDSGVEWLGQVPEHWVVSRIKNYAKIESAPSRQVEEYWIDCNIPWVSLNDSKTLKVVDYISDTFYKINELGMANSSAHLLPERAVVFTRDASIGLAAITTIPMAVSQHLIAWICNEKKVIPEFLLLIFYAMELEFERYTFGATIKTIGMDDVRSLTAGFPKIDEQKEIITWAFSTLGILKNVLQKAEEKICLLQERRTALITAAVTGKIDLRGWTPPVEEVAA